jgi:hypothetical protein
MLIISVVLSAAFLIFANVAAFRTKGHTIEVLASGLVLLVTAGCFGTAFFPSVMLQIISISVSPLACDGVAAQRFSDHLDCHHVVGLQSVRYCWLAARANQ